MWYLQPVWLSGWGRSHHPGHQCSRLRYLDEIFNSRVKTLISNKYNIAEELSDADLVIGAVLIPGARTPALITEEMVKNMKEGSVIVDVAIDQGGCVKMPAPLPMTSQSM